MSRPTRLQRLFVAARPPVAWVGPFLARVAGRTDLPLHAATDPAHAFVVVHFIGDVPGRDADGVLESVERSAAGLPAFELTPVELRTLPRSGATRQIAVVLDATPALREMKTRLVRRLARGSSRRPAEALEPHVTLARLTTPSAEFDWCEPAAALGFTVTAVELVRTVLHAGAYDHRVVATIPLMAGSTPGA